MLSHIINVGIVFDTQFMITTIHLCLMPLMVTISRYKKSASNIQDQDSNKLT